MNLIEIEDAQDFRVDVFSRFSDAELKRGWSSKGSIEQGPLFVAESRNVIERALDAGVVPAALFADVKWLAKADDLVQRICTEFPETPVYSATAELFKQITGYAQVRGILAAMHRPEPWDLDVLLAGSRRVAILENVVNYTNIGAIFRSAAALGVDGVLVTPSCHDPLYRRAARVSMGTVFQVPWAFIGDGDDWTRAGMSALRAHGFKTVALALGDDSVDIDDAELAACDKLAMVLGTEGDGLSPRTIASCDWTARIPMAHGVDSLNVAAASAVAFWELRCR